MCLKNCGFYSVFSKILKKILLNKFVTVLKNLKCVSHVIFLQPYDYKVLRKIHKYEIFQLKTSETNLFKIG